MGSMMTRDGPLWLVALSVASGASLGALLRWGLSYLLNPMSGWMPMGTFAANVLGGFLIGMALAWTAASPGIPPALRLFLITGFLGGLTTFSTLSGEAFTLMASGSAGLGLLLLLSHAAAGLTATWAGWLLWRTVF